MDMWITWSIIILVVVIFIYMWSKWLGFTKTLKEQGKIRKRNYDYYKQKHVFINKVDEFNKIIDALDKTILEEFCIEYSYEEEKELMYFQNKYEYNMLVKGTFKALLKKEKNEIDENYCYSFSILSWTGKEGGFQALDNVIANSLLTMIEKTMLQIDENTKIKNLYNKFKTD